MKALTVWQPWASLIVEGAKPYEFRGWRPPANRGPTIAATFDLISLNAGVRRKNKMETITVLPMHRLYSTVVRVFDGDKIGVQLATFEYGYQASEFAKSISRKSDGVIGVLGRGHIYFSQAFEKGKKHKGFALQIRVEV